MLYIWFYVENQCYNSIWTSFININYYLLYLVTWNHLSNIWVCLFLIFDSDVGHALPSFTIFYLLYLVTWTHLFNSWVCLFLIFVNYIGHALPSFTILMMIDHFDHGLARWPCISMTTMLIVIKHFLLLLIMINMPIIIKFKYLWSNIKILLLFVFIWL